MTSILFVTELCVWPPYGGERIHAYNVIDSLSRHFDVAVLAPRPSAGCPLLDQVHSWHDLPDVATSFWRRVADSRFVVMRRRSWRRLLERLLLELRPQVVWFNYGHWGHYADLVHRHGARVVQQTHNAQSRLERQGLASRPLTRWHLYCAVRYPLEAWHERRLFRGCDLVLSVSEADRRYHARFVGEARSLYQPNFINETWYQVAEPAARAAGLIVMTGNFGAFQNQVGARWFVKEVWPAVRQAVPTARLELVGIVPRGWRRRIEQTPGVTCTGAAPSVAPYLHQATVGIVPLLHGSGTRFKILEALACGLPLVSTTVGTEGIALTPGENGLLTDTPSEFAAGILRLLADPSEARRLADNGLTLLRREYSMAINTERLWRIVVELAGPPNRDQR
jgi:glycosyltransferase involved in cell wall biosynthesis